MRNDPLVLTFDMGTQSGRAVLVNTRGDIVAKKQKVYDAPYYSLNPGWAEQKPEFYWNAICEISQGMKAEHADIWDDIVAVSCTCIRDTCVCLDADGNPLRDIILWLDSREAKNLNNISRVNSMLFRLVQQTQMVESMRADAACNWIIANEPEIWEKTAQFLLLSGYLNYLFTGRFVDSTANIIGHIPFNVKTMSWCKPNDIKRSLFNIPEEKLCELVQPGTNIGGVSQQAAADTGIPAGTPFYVTGSDKGCETLALTCMDDHSAALSFGTTATIQITTDQYYETLPFIPPYPAIARSFNPELEIFRGYWLISWFKKEFAAKEIQLALARGVSTEQVLNEKLESIPPGCDGLILQPYFTPGVNMPNAKGALIGFSDIHTRMHIYRAIIEGVNFGLMEGLYLIEKRGKTKIDRLFLAGGGSQSAEICQITANMFGLPVHRIHTHEACGLGSSLVTFVGNGTFRSYEDAYKSMVHNRDTFKPDMQEHRIYKEIYDRVYAKLYDLLSPLYAQTDEILNLP